MSHRWSAEPLESGHTEDDFHTSGMVRAPQELIDTHLEHILCSVQVTDTNLPLDGDIKSCTKNTASYVFLLRMSPSCACPGI